MCLLEIRSAPMEELMLDDKKLTLSLRLLRENSVNFRSLDIILSVYYL